MAYVTIITGTHQFYDLYKFFTSEWASQCFYRYNVNGVVFEKRRFERVIITKQGEVVFLPPVLAHLGNGSWVITQTMGSGKTILGMEHLARVHRREGNTAANISVEWFDENKGSSKEVWMPSINSIEDLEDAKNTTLLIDDVKKTIRSWQTKEANLISSIVNTSRKESVDLLITTQRVINFVPKDIREVVSNYEIPYITIRDMRYPTPDNMGYPVEMDVFNLSANNVFMGFGVYNGFVPDNKILMPSTRLLNCYSTMEVAVGLKKDDPETKRKRRMEGRIINGKEPYVGYNNERTFFDNISKYKGTAVHLSAEKPNQHFTDIVFTAENGDIYAVDVVGVKEWHKGNSYFKSLYTNDKDISSMYYRLKRRGYIPALGFQFKDDSKIILMEDIKMHTPKTELKLTQKRKELMHPLIAFFEPID